MNNCHGHMKKKKEKNKIKQNSCTTAANEWMPVAISSESNR